jgi:predicted  nucleic acid-binding Zn-ribbon protein
LNEETALERAIERAVSAEKDAEHALDGVKRINGQIVRLSDRVGSLEGSMNQGFAALRQDIANLRVEDRANSSLLATSLKVAAFIAAFAASGLAAHFFN